MHTAKFFLPPAEHDFPSRAVAIATPKSFESRTIESSHFHLLRASPPIQDKLHRP
jgi:hypothetical protein